MIYATLQDMIDRFGALELTQLTADAGDTAPDAGKVQRALDDAHAYVDGFVGAVYALPLAGCAKPAPVPGDVHASVQVPPPALVRQVCDVARYYLYDQVAPEHEVMVRFKAAQRDLEGLATGRSVLACPWGGSPGVQLSGLAPGDAEVQYRFTRHMGDEQVAGYR